MTQIVVGCLLIALAVVWFLFKEFARGMTATPSMHSMSHAASGILAIVGAGLIVVGCLQ